MDQLRDLYVEFRGSLVPGLPSVGSSGYQLDDPFCRALDGHLLVGEK